jgi:hypothetical protein
MSDTFEKTLKRQFKKNIYQRIFRIIIFYISYINYLNKINVKNHDIAFKLLRKIFNNILINSFEFYYQS